MDPRFAHVVDSLHPAFERLTQMDPLPSAAVDRPPAAGGVYLISENGRNLYVGRSRNLRNRYGAHRNASSRTQSAALAFLFAREATGHLKPTYAPGEGSRTWLSNDARFMTEFEAAKARIRTMQFRFVVEEDPIRQTVLEVYCAVILETPYNKFETT